MTTRHIQVLRRKVAHGVVLLPRAVFRNRRARYRERSEETTISYKISLVQ
jgi:hypothetical protein